MKDNRRLSVYFNRTELNENIIEEKYSMKNFKSDNIFQGTRNYLLKYYKPSRSCMKMYFLERFPFFKWITEYDYKANLFSDFISGLTIGIIQIPQGLAYSLMVFINFYSRTILYLQKIFLGWITSYYWIVYIFFYNAYLCPSWYISSSIRRLD